MGRFPKCFDKPLNALNFYSFDVGLRERLSGHDYGQDTVFKGGRGSVLIGILGQRERSLEGAVAAFHAVEIFASLLLVLPFFTANGQRIVGNLDFDILLIDAWHFDADGVLVVRRAQIQGGPEYAVVHARHHRPFQTETSKSFIEKAVDLAMKALYGAVGFSALFLDGKWLPCLLLFFPEPVPRVPFFRAHRNPAKFHYE